MAQTQQDQRQWERFSADNPVRFTTGGRTRKGQLRDISASGAAFDIENPDGDDDSGRLSIDDFGEYETRVVRNMNDGFAVMLELDEVDQNILHDELSDYFGNDAMALD